MIRGYSEENNVGFKVDEIRGTEILANAGLPKRSRIYTSCLPGFTRVYTFTHRSDKFLA